ncbi:hypothetical protein Leryth_021622 [Lithospermum erythrorhizon]|nr:hypothetical protein Leryth_021622 [Lithospermum erythrorhizon]
MLSLTDSVQCCQSYEYDPLPGYQQLQLGNRSYPETWEDYCLGGNSDEVSSDYRKANTSSRIGFTSTLANLEADDQKSVTGSTFNNHVNVTRASPSAAYCKSRRSSLGDLNSEASCNKYRPFRTSTEIDAAIRSGKSSNIVFPLTDSHSAVQSHTKTKGLNLSWLFPRLKKKNKNVNSPNRSESEDASNVMVETLKKELLEASEIRDAALMEVSEMKSSVGDLHKKLEYLETYCEELKKALVQAAQTKNSHVGEKLGSLPKKGKSIDGDGDNLMPVSEEVMVEGFLQIVAEARLSVKQFCKALLFQIEETDKSLVDNLNLHLQPYKLSLDSKYSKAVLYHLEAIINQTLYQDFENCVFQKNGSQKQLDPQQYRQAQFSSFVALRNLSWNEVLRKGTKYYSEEFSKFCDQKMSGIISSLSWTRPWPEQLLQTFFVAAKCIWLLHLLAFSFGPPLGILRVEENRAFDQQYMEDIFADKQKSRGASKVKVMVMPGFYVHDRVLRCKVLCRYRSAP